LKVLGVSFHYGSGSVTICLPGLDPGAMKLAKMVYFYTDSDP